MNQAHKFSNAGFIAAAVLALALLAVNGGLLWRWNGEVSAEQKAAEEAAKPAEIQIVKITDATCTDCFDAGLLVSALKENKGISISKEEAVDYSSPQGKVLINSNKLSKIPALLLTGDIEKAVKNASFLTQFGKQQGDTFVVENLLPPYLELSSGKVRGRFSIIYLTDKSCATCYDVSNHKKVLESIGAKPTEEQIIDRSDPQGAILVSQYSIEKVPTIILRGDIAEYSAFRQVWPAVGSAEKDGTYVFRATELMGTYHDLKTGKTVASK
jgi:hypothetical protein